MKYLYFFLLFFFLTIVTCHSQEHPFQNINKLTDKQEFISQAINALYYAEYSPNFDLEELRTIIKANNLLDTNEKYALDNLINVTNGTIPEGMTTVEYLEKSIEGLDENSNIYAFATIFIAERAALFVYDDFESRINNMEVYKSNAYPDWLKGYLYAALSLGKFRQNDDKLFLHYADSASLYLANNGHFTKQAQLYHTVGDELFFKGIDTANVFLHKAIDLEIEHELDYLKLKTLTDLAGVDRFAEDYESCLDKQYEVIKLAEELKDTSFIVEGKFRLSVTMAAQGGKQNLEAEKVVLEAQSLAEKIGNESLYARSFGYLGSIYMSMEDYEKALPNIKKKIALNKSNDKETMIIPYLEMGLCYSQLGILDSAYYAVNKSNEYNNGRNQYFTQYGELILTDYYISKKQYDKAKVGAELGLELAGDYDKSMKLAALDQLRKIYEARRDYKKAYEYFVELNDVEYLINNEDLSLQISEARIEADFEAEKKIIEIEAEKEKSIAAAKQRQYMYITGFALLIAALLAGLYFLIRSKNKQLSQKSDELTRLNDVKDQLFQIIGHDLRKPVIAFRKVSENMNYLIEKGEQKRLVKLGEEIEQEGKTLYNLTDNLLHWALLQKDLLTLNPTNISLGEIINENTQLFKKAFQHKEITITSDINHDHIKTDKNALNTIIRNLLDNAIKYTPKGGKINITSKEENGQLLLSIQDSGVGIEESQLKDILLGSNVESMEGTNKETGSAIGLKIIHSLIEKIGGKLQVNSEKMIGTTFSIQLPIASS